jgi:hypothetical protein
MVEGLEIGRIERVELQVLGLQLVAPFVSAPERYLREGLVRPSPRLDAEGCLPVPSGPGVGVDVLADLRTPGDVGSRPMRDALKVLLACLGGYAGSLVVVLVLRAVLVWIVASRAVPGVLGRPLVVGVYVLTLVPTLLVIALVEAVLFNR